LRREAYLVNVGITDGERDIMLLSNAGKAMRFQEREVRAMGRTAAGVRGIRLEQGQHVIALLILGEGDILTATENGYGKRTPLDDYPRRGRGGMGVISIRTGDRNGEVVGAGQVVANDEIMLITRKGTLVRTPVSGISTMSRNTQGVKLIALGKDETLVGLERLELLDEDGDVDVDDNDSEAPSED
ncbi:MAG: DNA gyrase subunit A, partial [Ectothiorhodospiraceae bacterium]|nr:DNA gyrase subunit A [Ectothiorhodospiraceae bacterium]